MGQFKVDDEVTVVKICEKDKPLLPLLGKTGVVAEVLDIYCRVRFPGEANTPYALAGWWWHEDCLVGKEHSVDVPGIGSVKLKPRRVG